MATCLCSTCGTGYPPAASPPIACPIREDERQYLRPSGQTGTTLEALRHTHKTAIHYEGEFLGIGVTPSFGIGQRALLVRTPNGNVLLDCIALVDQASVDLIEGLGSLAGIAVSHPRATVLEHGRLVGGVRRRSHPPARRRSRMGDAASPHLAFWDGERAEILPGLTLVRCNGHYDSGTVMHVAAAAGGNGALLAGDILLVTADRKHVGLMRSDPNFLPLGAAAVRKIAAALEGLSYEAVYGPFWDALILGDGNAAVARSIACHIDWIERLE